VRGRPLHQLSGGALARVGRTTAVAVVGDADESIEFPRQLGSQAASPAEPCGGGRSAKVALGLVGGVTPGRYSSADYRAHSAATENWGLLAMAIFWLGRWVGSRTCTAFNRSSIAHGLRSASRYLRRVHRASAGARNLERAGARASVQRRPLSFPCRPLGRATLATVAGWVLAALLVGPAVAEAQNATGKPNIWGHKVEGERLTLGLGGISDPDGEPFTNIHRAWYRVNASNVETRIRGAIGNWYEPVQADVGKRIKVEVSFRDAADNRETVTSDLTTPIIARPRVTIHDLTVTEPSSGTQDYEVRVSLDRASAARRTIQINFRYVEGTAVAKNVDPRDSSRRGAPFRSRSQHLGVRAWRDGNDGSDPRQRG